MNLTDFCVNSQPILTKLQALIYMIYLYKYLCKFTILIKFNSLNYIAMSNSLNYEILIKISHMQL